MKGREELDALGNLFTNLFALRFRHPDLEFRDRLRQVNPGEGITHSFSAHLGDEGVRAVGLTRFTVFVFAEQLMKLERSGARIDHQIILVIDHALEISRRDVHHQADAGRHALEEPDVRHRHRQFDVAHALATNACQGHLDTATIADDAAMLDALVLSARAFPVLDGTEDALAEETALLRLERAVVDGLRVLDFTLGPGADGLWGRDGNRHVVNLVDLVEAEQFASGFFSVDHRFNEDFYPLRISYRDLPVRSAVSPVGPPGWCNLRLHPFRGTAFPSPAR